MKQSIWEQENSLARTFWQNGRADFPIYDMHAHMGQHNAIFHTCPEADHMVKHAKRIGVKRLCFSHYYSLFDDGGNDLAAVIQSRSKRFFAGDMFACHQCFHTLIGVEVVG